MYSQTDSCKIEIATFLAHVAHETNDFNDEFDETDEWFASKTAGMFQEKQSPACTLESIDHADCKQGPLMMDKDTYDNFFVGKVNLPEDYIEDGETFSWDKLNEQLFWLSGLFEFTFANQKPSMYVIATDLWYPSEAEYEAGIEGGLGATIAIRHPELCGTSNAIAGSIKKFYVDFLELFEFDLRDFEIKSCSETDDISEAYPENYYIEDLQFFDIDDECALVNTAGDYNIFNKNSYFDCKKYLREAATFEALDSNSDNVLSEIEAAAGGMSPGCYQMYYTYTASMSPV